MIKKIKIKKNKMTKEGSTLDLSFRRKDVFIYNKIGEFSIKKKKLTKQIRKTGLLKLGTLALRTG